MVLQGCNTYLARVVLAQVNARFVPATFVLGGKCTYCSQKTVHGSFVKSAFFAALTSTNLTVRVAYHADTPSRASIAVDAEGIEGAFQAMYQTVLLRTGYVTRLAFVSQ